MMTYQKHPVGTCPGESSPTRVCIVVFDTSSAAGVVSAAQDQQTERLIFSPQLMNAAGHGC